MSMSSLKAGTQYGDWKGTAAADEFGAERSFEELFEATGKVDKENEILIAFEFYAGEGIFMLSGYFHPKSASTDLGWIPSLNKDFQMNAGSIPVRTVSVEISRDEFFKHFKRFNVVMIHHGLEISGRDLEISEA